MNNPRNVFITESNVELYLSKAYECLDPKERDVLLRLILEEERRMGHRREHVEAGERRLNGCRERLQRQRDVVAALPPDALSLPKERFLLETMEQAWLLFEEHQRILLECFASSRL